MKVFTFLVVAFLLVNEVRSLSGNLPLNDTTLPPPTPHGSNGTNYTNNQPPPPTGFSSLQSTTPKPPSSMHGSVFPPSLSPAFQPLLCAIFPPTSWTADQVKTWTILTDDNAWVNYLKTLLKTGAGLPGNIADAYYGFLEMQYVINNKTTWLDIDTIKSLAARKTDCNFNLLLKPSNRNPYAQNVTSFISNLQLWMSGNPAWQQCPSNPFYPKPTINGAGDVAALLQGGNVQQVPPEKMKLLSPDQALSFANSSSLGANQAQALASKIPCNTPIDQVPAVASAFFRKCPGAFKPDPNNPNQLATLITSGRMDVSNMPPAQKGQLVNSLNISNTSPNTLANVMNQDPNMARAIPFNKLPPSITPANLTYVPPAMASNYVSQQLQSQTLTQMVANVDPATLGKVAAVLSPSQLSTVSSPQTASTILATAGSALSNVQVNSIYKAAINGRISQLNSTQLQNMAQAFIQAPASDKASLADSSSSNMQSVINGLNGLSCDDCAKYSQQIKQNFTAYATQYLIGSGTNVSATMINTLGPCLASTISVSQFSQLSASDFQNTASVWNSKCFQPSDSMIQQVSAKIDALVTNAGAVQTNVDSIVSSLSSTIMYYNKTSSNAQVQSSLGTYSANILSSVNSNKNPSNSTVALSQLGSNSSSSTTSQSINTLKQLVGKAAASLSRRKRQTTTLTCSVVSAQGYGDIFSAAFLQTITVADFPNCLTTLGSSSNVYSNAQITALLSVAINGASKVYASVSVIPDADIQSLNVLLTGFTATQLSQLNISSSGSIQTLGLLSSWQSDQLTSAVAAVKVYLTANSLTLSSVLGNLGSLACGLSSSDVSGLTDTDLSNNYAALKSIQNTVCPAAGYFYSRFKVINGFTTLNSVYAADMGGITGGISASDLAAMTPETFLSFSSAAIKNINDVVMNSLSTTVLTNLLSATTSAQVSAFMNSGYYSSFSATVQNALVSLQSGTSPTVTAANTNTGSGSTMVEFNLACLITTIGLAFWVKRF